MKHTILLLVILFGLSSCYQTKLTLTKGKRIKTFSTKADFTFFTSERNSNGDSIQTRCWAWIISVTPDSIKLSMRGEKRLVYQKNKLMLKFDTLYAKDSIVCKTISIKAIYKIEKQRVVIGTTLNTITALAFVIFIEGAVTAPFSKKDDWPANGKILGLSVISGAAALLLNEVFSSRTFCTTGYHSWAIQK